MSVSLSSPLLSVGYAFYSNRDAMFGGLVRSLDEAQQECQGVAEAGLHWSETEFDLWEAPDPTTLAVYEINAREY